ncbi:MAG: hypothetical protein LLF76_01335, partial [Planctomycetaceae bacterium]|nr:hypothetical protein [Planctomycetaceae bacterium]
QQGSYVADVCYFISENAPKMTGVRDPELPQGYSYDYINAEVIVRDMQVKDGKLVLPSGAAYRLMVLPPLETMRPAVLAKLEKLVKEGGAIYGPKPSRSPSLQGYPECDLQVRAMADEMWGANYSGGKLSRKYGQGSVFNSLDLQQVLDQLRVSRDVDLSEASVLWTHRTIPGMDIYFLSNQSDRRVDIQPVFRVEGLKPQLWDAMTGQIRRLPEYSQMPQGTAVPISLEPRQSQFIVFAEGSTAKGIAEYQSNFPQRKSWKTIDGPWTVEFSNSVIDVQKTLTMDTLVDWSKSDSDSIKHYSGTAVYTAEFSLDQVPEGKDVFVNLGSVHVMAEVTVNGKPAGGVWMEPFVLDVTNLIKPGKNVIEAEVVNLWRNYLVKEQGMPESQRKTWLTVSDVKANEDLQPSGLIGPVVLETLDRK